MKITSVTSHLPVITSMPLTFDQSVSVCFHAHPMQFVPSSSAG